MKIKNPSGLPTIDYRKVKPLQGNLKDLTDDNAAKLKGVLERRGFEVPLFVWFEGDTPWLIDGHQRHRIMTKFDMHDDGSRDVPYVKIEAANKKEAKAKLLEISSQFGHITYEGFDEFAADLPMAEVIEAVAFDALPLLGQDAEDPPEDEPPPISSQPAASKRGEIYKLGGHLLMCGDATREEDYTALMAGPPADMVFTDPPYGVEYEGKTDEALKISNDDFEGLKDLLEKAFTGCLNVMRSGAPIYVCYAEFNRTIFIEAFKDRFKLSQLLVWVKNNFTMGRYDYHWRHEGLLYGWKPGAAHAYYGGRRQDTVWEIDRPAASREHPTMKPIALVSRAVKNSSKKGDVVLDPFGGSGSTLIACEHLGRRCRMMELDPKYCDVIRKRYAELLGKQDEWEALTPPVAGTKQEA